MYTYTRWPVVRYHDTHTCIMRGYLHSFIHNELYRSGSSSGGCMKDNMIEASSWRQFFILLLPINIHNVASIFRFYFNQWPRHPIEFPCSNRDHGMKEEEEEEKKTLRRHRFHERKYISNNLLVWLNSHVYNINCVGSIALTSLLWHHIIGMN